jgi:hypothetical protein
MDMGYMVEKVEMEEVFLRIGFPISIILPVFHTCFHSAAIDAIQLYPLTASLSNYNGMQ